MFKDHTKLLNVIPLPKGFMGIHPTWELRLATYSGFQCYGYIEAFSWILNSWIVVKKIRIDS